MVHSLNAMRRKGEEVAVESSEAVEREHGPAGTMIHSGRHGTQLVSTRGHRWSDEAEELFLDHLAATANVSASAKACGFSAEAVYCRRRKDGAFLQRWDVALAQGYAHMEALLVQRSIEALEGFAPDPDTPIVIRDMTVKDALMLLGHHRRQVEGGPRSKRWARPKSFEECRESILRKVEAIERMHRDEQEAEAAVIGSLTDLLGR